MWRRTPDTWYPRQTPSHHGQLQIDCCHCGIKSIVFVDVSDLCPKLWEILSTLFFLQITHRKGPLANHICRGLQLSFGLQRDIVRPVLSWDRERGPLSAFRRVQPNLLMNCNSTAWSLDQSLQPSTSSFPHILNREAQMRSLIHWFQSTLSSATQWPHDLSYCSKQQ